MGRRSRRSWKSAAIRERRAPTAKRLARAGFQRLLGRMLEKSSPGWKLQSLVSAADLEHSFGPAYVRGLLRRGSSAMAVVGVGAGEAQAAVDGIIATAVLWMEHCRERHADRMHVAGARLFVPRGGPRWCGFGWRISTTTLARWELCGVRRAEPKPLEELDARDAGNLSTRLVQAPDRERAPARFAEAIARVQQILPRAEIEVVSAAEISFRYHGLEFARATMREVAGSFRTEPVLLFPDTEASTVGAEIVVDSAIPSLDSATSCERVAAMRDGADRHHPLHRAARSAGWRRASGETSACSTSGWTRRSSTRRCLPSPAATEP